jgi:Tfp pilus assembly protein PilF
MAGDANAVGSLERMLAIGQDSALLRMTLASRYFTLGDFHSAIRHAEVAVELDADYSAAWKILGKAQAASGMLETAADTYQRGIEVAERRGDRQAAKEMRVFLRRLQRSSAPPRPQ